MKASERCRWSASPTSAVAREAYMSVNGPRRVGLYPGTFDPLTLGHLDIVKRAVKLVDHLVIGVATNASKSPLFSIEERIAMMQHEIEKLPAGRATVAVLPVSDILLVEFARSIGA